MKITMLSSLITIITIITIKTPLYQHSSPLATILTTILTINHHEKSHFYHHFIIQFNHDDKA